MKSNKKPWPLKSTHGIRERINTNPDFQRPAVWGTAQKQLLVDTILRDYDIPKLYWRKSFVETGQIRCCRWPAEASGNLGIFRR